jgi:hypothetical protein
MAIRSVISPGKQRNQNIQSDSMFSRSPRNKHKLMGALAKPAAFLMISREKVKPVSCRWGHVLFFHQIEH